VSEGPTCGHSACSQNYIDTEERECIVPDKTETIAAESGVEAALRLANRNGWVVVAVWPAARLNDDGVPVAHTVVSDTGSGPGEGETFAVHIMHTLEGGFSHLVHGDYGLTIEGAQSLALLRAKEAR
jgi:hypothetical protein